MHTCTWAPTVFSGIGSTGHRAFPTGADLTGAVTRHVAKVEALGIDHLLIAQRWWGSAEEIEGSSFDCLAMTAYFAAVANRLHLITAVHPGFFHPSSIAKWGSTIAALTDGRWAINVTSGWHLQEFSMYGVDPLTHDERYRRSAEFIEVLRGAWTGRAFDHAGTFYRAEGLLLEPPPSAPLVVFQGGQSDAAIEMAAGHSDWMFLNGGSLQKITDLVARVRDACRNTGRRVRFALYAAPLCRDTDDDAWEVIDRRLAAIDPELVARRRQTLGGAQGMWSGEDPLSHLDTNEGYAARLIGCPDTVIRRIGEFHRAGIDMLHLDIRDELFNREVLPVVHTL